MIVWFVVVPYSVCANEQLILCISFADVTFRVEDLGDISAYVCRVFSPTSTTIPAGGLARPDAVSVSEGSARNSALTGNAALTPLSSLPNAKINASLSPGRLASVSTADRYW
jgi:hypothetical protein